MLPACLNRYPDCTGIQDAWAIYDYLGQIFGPWDDIWEGGLDGKLIPGFESTYLRYGGFRGHEITAYSNEDQFNEIFHKYSFRITLREAKQEGGKDKMILKYSKWYFDMHTGIREIYDELEEELETTVNEAKVSVPTYYLVLRNFSRYAEASTSSSSLPGSIPRRVNLFLRNWFTSFRSRTNSDYCLSEWSLLRESSSSSADSSTNWRQFNLL